MITVLADKYLYQVSSFLHPAVRLRCFDPHADWPPRLDDVDALLIRTVNKINESTLRLLPDSLKFIGTGSAGTDHVDTDLLDRRGIAFASAAGCNARSVAEYVATGLLIWAEKRNQELSRKTVGIVGAGHVGSVLQQLLKAMGVPFIVYDPPKSERESTFTSADLQEVLAADILSFHTPLTRTGSHPTFHWLDAEKLKNHAFDLVVNTARGGVVDEAALLRFHASGNVGDMITDVWETEPEFNDELARRSFIKTPHIAGYSIQAKLNASKIICEQLLRFFNLNPVSPFSELAVPQQPAVSLRAGLRLSDVLTSLHPVFEYQRELVKLIGTEPGLKSHRFNTLRAEFPLRNEFHAYDLPTSLLVRHPILKAFL